MRSFLKITTPTIAAMDKSIATTKPEMWLLSPVFTAPPSAGFSFLLFVPVCFCCYFQSVLSRLISNFRCDLYISGFYSFNNTICIYCCYFCIRAAPYNCFVICCICRIEYYVKFCCLSFFKRSYITFDFNRL